jgi:bile acid-coenzyme A ligase
MTVMSYGRAMGWLAAQSPERVAIICEEETITRMELESRSNRLARAYEALGVEEGDKVTLALPNSIQFQVACMAVWKLGATPQPVSTRLPEMEWRAIVELADPALIVGLQAGEHGDCPTVPARYEPDVALSDAPLPDRVPRFVRAMSSGGSTGRPKLIVEHRPAETDPEVAENRMRLGGTTLVPGPLHHSGPLIVSWQALLSGGCVVLLTRFDARRCLEAIDRYRVDWVLFVPTMMQRIWRLPEEERTRWDVSSLETVMCSGSPCPVWLKHAWIDWLGGDRIYEAYGGAERVGATLISGTEWLEHPGSVGKPQGGTRIKILGPEGEELPPGEMGEVYLMPAGGPGSTYHYLGSEAKATNDGWESLGDLGYVDEDGYLYLVDRLTDMVVTGGANVYPAEVEAALDAHPSVRSSAVIGLPDDDLGQRVHAIVDSPVALLDEELRVHLAQYLAPYKLPRSFEHVDEPLRDDAGKVRRPALREARLAALDAQGQAAEKGNPT